MTTSTTDILLTDISNSSDFIVVFLIFISVLLTIDFVRRTFMPNRDRSL